MYQTGYILYIMCLLIGLRIHILLKFRVPESKLYFIKCCEQPTYFIGIARAKA